MSEDRKTFTVPDGFEAVFSADGRATGEIRKTRETLEREASHWLQQARDNLKAGQDCLAKLEAAEAREARLSEAFKVISTAADALIEDSLNRTKAGMSWGIHGHPTISPKSMHDLKVALFSARAALSGSGSGWRTMDSAPKDGTRFLAYVKDGEVDFFHWQHLDHANAPIGWRDSFIQVYREDDPNGPQGWMPLPAAPQQGGE